VWVLVVEDQDSMAQLLRQGLEEANHTVTVAHDGGEALTAADMCAIDAIVLDVMLPGIDGIEVTRRLRAKGSQMPILMLTARDAPADVVKGLDAGADDYLTKPFPLKVLLARLRALSRRAPPPPREVLKISDLVLDPATHDVTRGGEPIELTSTEFRLLEYLLRRPGRVCSRATIIDGVWGLDTDVQPNTVDVYIKLLRAKIDKDRPTLIQTIRGYGYVMRDDQ
jgi:DNA-binding response OmpR family regulator